MIKLSIVFFKSQSKVTLLLGFPPNSQSSYVCSKDYGSIHKQHARLPHY